MNTKRLILVIILSWLMGDQSAFAQVNPPRLSDSMAIIQQPNTFIRNPLLSPDGNYLYTETSLVDLEQVELGYTPSASTISRWHQLWDMSGLTENGEADVVQLESISQIEVDLDLYAGAAFSHNSELVAIRTTMALQIRSIPTLELINEVVLDTPELPDISDIGWLSEVRWSEDDQFVAVLDGSDFVVWQRTENRLIRYALPSNDDVSVAVTSSGWIIAFSNQAERIAFISCTRMLETCETYTFAEMTHTIEVFDEGALIFTIAGDVASESRSFGIWSQQSNGQYLLEEATPSTLLRPPLALNNSENLLLTGYLSQSVWNYPELDFVWNVPLSNSQSIWLRNNSYLVSVDRDPTIQDLSLYLYDVGNDEPLDNLVVNVSEINELYNSEITVTFPEQISLSENNNYLLVHLTWLVMIISIE